MIVADGSPICELAAGSIEPPVASSYRGRQRNRSWSNTEHVCKSPTAVRAPLSRDVLVRIDLGRMSGSWPPLHSPSPQSVSSAAQYRPHYGGGVERSDTHHRPPDDRRPRDDVLLGNSGHGSRKAAIAPSAAMITHVVALQGDDVSGSVSNTSIVPSTLESRFGQRDWRGCAQGFIFTPS
jgi:hypothetical protein